MESFERIKSDAFDLTQDQLKEQEQHADLPDASMSKYIKDHHSKSDLLTAAGLPEINLAITEQTSDGPAEKKSGNTPAPLRLPDNLIRVPLTRQATDYTCVASALQSVLRYYGDTVTEQDLAKELKSSVKDGTSFKAVEQYAQKHGYEVTKQLDASLEDLKHTIDQGKPALILIQAWADPPVDYKNDWDDGHCVVATGYDAHNIYFMDPWTLGNYTYIPIPEFLERWHDVDDDKKVNHIIMTVTKPKPAYDPADIPKLNNLPEPSIQHPHIQNAQADKAIYKDSCL